MAGRSGVVLLGPTEARVARYLEHATAHGLVVLSAARIGADLQLCRSETYRILRRLRILGLFGIANDPAGLRGGRRIWRTPRRQDGPALDPVKHREAWARVSGWLAGRARATLARVRAIAQAAESGGPPLARLGRSGPSFAERMALAGLSRDAVKAWAT